MRLMSLFVICLLNGPILAGDSASASAVYATKVATLKDGDADGHYQLAQWCRGVKLIDQMTAEATAAIAINPEHAGARKLLGHEKIKGQWLSGEPRYKAKGWVKYHGQWMPIERQRSMERRQVKLRELAKQRSDWTKAWVLKTEHYQFKSNCTPRVVEEIAQAMEVCWKEQSGIFNLTKTWKPVSVEVYATQEQFLKYSAEAGIPMNYGVLGYFAWGGNSNTVIIRCFYAGSIEDTLSTLFHESTHLMMYTYMGGGDQVPTWLNEGLAVYFEDAQRDDKKLNIQGIPFGRLWHLQKQLEERDISLDELTALDGMYAYTGERYPQGWSLVHFFLYADKAKYRKAFMAYLEALRQQRNKDPGDLFRATFGGNPNIFKKRWEAYVKALEPVTGTDFIAAADTACNRWLDFDKAKGYVEQALAKAGTNWKAHLAAGRYHLRRGLMADDATEFAPAAAAYAKALELKGAPRGGKSPGLAINLVRVEQAQALGLSGDYQAAEDLLEAVLADDELCTSAYATLAWIHLTATDPEVKNLDAAKEYLQIADDLGKSHETLYVHALMEVAAGNKAKAITYLEDAAEGDAYGFRGRFYQKEAMRLELGSRIRIRPAPSASAPAPSATAPAGN